MIAHAGPVAEVVHELPRRVGVVVVEVREREAAVLLTPSHQLVVPLPPVARAPCWCGFSP